MKEQLEKGFYNLCWGAIKLFYPKTTAVGLENLPREPAIIVGNHSHPRLKGRNCSR